MSSQGPPQAENFRMPGIYDAVRRIAVYGTLLFLVGLIAYLMIRAFDGGLYPGVRSSAGALLPLIVVSFLFVFHREILEQLGAIPTIVAFLLSLGAGIAVMVVIRLFAQRSGIPVAELVLSGCFSILVFGSGSLKDQQILSYYYGVIGGLLLYIILFGFPLLA